MSTFQMDLFFRQLEHFVMKGEGWAHLDVCMTNAVTRARAIPFPPRRAQALLLCARFGWRRATPEFTRSRAKRFERRTQAMSIALEAFEAIKTMDHPHRDSVAADAVEVFLEEFDLFGEAKCLAELIKDPPRKAKACVKVGLAAVGFDDVRPWISQILSVCTDGSLDEDTRTTFLMDAELLKMSAERYA